MTYDELPLDERTDLLTAWCDSPPEGADLPGLVGLLGATLLERYERDGDLDLLESAIDRYGEALRAAPAHEDRTSWYLGLGLAHGGLAVRLPDPARHDQAIEWLSRLYNELPPADPGHEDATMLLIEAHWERYCERQSTLDWGGAEAAAEARTGDGSGRRYAVQDAVISYSASGRMLCAAARHRLRPVRSALVVGDPDGSLPFAAAEARHPSAFLLRRQLLRTAREPRHAGRDTRAGAGVGRRCRFWTVPFALRVPRRGGPAPARRNPPGAG
jgi:hypothetical protein